MPTHKPYTFAIRSKKPTAQGKIAKEYVLPTLSAEWKKKIASR